MQLNSESELNLRDMHQGFKAEIFENKLNPIACE